MGSIDEMEIDDADNSEKNTGSAPDSKSRGKRKLYVGSQDLGFRRDHMEVSVFHVYFWGLVIAPYFS